MDGRSLRPRRNLVLVRPDSRETETAGGIIIPDTAKQKIDRGTVLAVGPDVDESEVFPQMVVGFRHYAGIPVEHEGAACILLEDAECLAEAYEAA